MKFSVPIIPHAQMRVQASPWGRGVYDHPKQRAEVKKLVLALRPLAPPQPLAGPLYVTITALLPIPGSWSGVKQSKARKGFIRPLVTPDVDNLAKHSLDCLTKAEFWEDDKQVVKLTICKRYDDGQGPRWDMEIQTAGEAAIEAFKTLFDEQEKKQG